jgi:hypothetical protein
MQTHSRLFFKAAALAAAIAVFGCQAQPADTAPKAQAVRVLAQPRPHNVPAHVQTAEYLWTPEERQTDPHVYAPYLTWAYPLYSTAEAVHDAGIKTIFYVNPVMPQQGEYEYRQLTGRYGGVGAKDCGGNPVTTYGGKGLLADPRSPNAASYYADVINWYLRNKLHGREDVDALFVDNNGALYGANPLPCNYDARTWGRAFDRAIEATGLPIVTNSLAARDTATYVDRLSAKNIAGGMFEECFNDHMWAPEESSQLQTIALLEREHKRPGPGWWCYLNNTSQPGSQSIAQRLFAYASFLLTYNPNYSVFQESFTTDPSTFKVFPETGFVPMGPTIVPHDVDDLKTPSGAYVQYYSWCYFRKKPLGPCEIAVNPQTGSASVPNPNRLHHSMVLTGGGVLDGGLASFNGPAVTDLDPHTAAIMAR